MELTKEKRERITKQIRSYYPGSQPDLIEPILYDNNQPWDLLNKRRGVFFGNFFLSQGTKVVIKSKGQNFVIDRETQKEVLFEEIVGLTGMEQAVFENFTINSTDIFDDNDVLKFEVNDLTITVKTLSDVLIGTITLDGLGNQTGTDGTINWDLEVTKLPSGEYTVVVDYQLKMYQYIPAVAGLEVTRDVVDKLSGIEINSQHEEILKLEVTADSYILSGQYGAQYFSFSKENGEKNYVWGVVTFTEEIPVGIYHIDIDSQLYAMTEGTAESNSTETVNKTLEGIGFSVVADSIYKMVVNGNNMTIFRYDSGNWFYVAQRQNKVGIYSGITTTKKFLNGVYYFDDEFNLLLNMAVFNGEFSKLPFIDIDYQGEQDFFRLKAIYSGYDYSQLKIEINSVWYDLAKLNANFNEQTISVNGENVVIKIDSEIGTNKSSIDEKLSSIFDFEKTNGEVIFEYEMLPDGELINVISESEFANVTNQVPVISENIEVHVVSPVIFPSEYIKINIKEEDVNNIRISVLQGNGTFIHDFLVEKTRLTGFLDTYVNLAIHIKQAFDFNIQSEYEYIFDHEGNLYDYIPAGAETFINKKFPFGDISVLDSLFNGDSYNKLVVKVSRNGLTVRFDLEDIQGRSIDVLFMNSDLEEIQISELGLFSIVWNAGVTFLELEAIYIIDGFDFLYEMTDNGSEIIEVNKTFDFISFDWGTYSGDKIVKLVPVETGVEILVDDVSKGIITENGGSVIFGDSEITLELLSVVDEEFLVDGVNNVVISKGGYTNPEHIMESYENDNIRMSNIDFSKFTGKAVITLIANTCVTDGFVAFFRQEDGTVIEYEEFIHTTAGQKIIMSCGEVEILGVLEHATHTWLNACIDYHYQEYAITDYGNILLAVNNVLEKSIPVYPYMFTNLYDDLDGTLFGMGIMNNEKVAVYSDAKSATYPNNGWEWDVQTGSLNIHFYPIAYNRNVNIRKKGVGVALSTLGLVMTGAPLESGIIGVWNYENSTNYGYGFTHENGDYWVNQVNNSGNMLAVGKTVLNGGTLTAISDGSVEVINPGGISFYYDITDGLCYDVEIDNLKDNFTISALITIPEEVVGEFYEIQTEQIQNFTIEPTFEIIQESTGNTSSYQFNMITEDSQVSTEITEFEYENIMLTIENQFDFVNDTFENPVFVPAIPDTYAIEVTEQTWMEGAEDAKTIPVTVSGQLNLTVYDSNNGEIETGVENGETNFNVVPAFQFNGYFIEFD